MILWWSVYIKQGGEVESRGGAGALESTPDSYWRAPPLDAPHDIHRYTRTHAQHTQVHTYVHTTYTATLLSSKRLYIHFIKKISLLVHITAMATSELYIARSHFIYL